MAIAYFEFAPITRQDAALDEIVLVDHLFVGREVELFVVGRLNKLDHHGIYVGDGLVIEFTGGNFSSIWASPRHFSNLI